jgi:hypothetical protein
VFKSLFGRRAAARPAPKPPQRTRLSLESLESREVPATGLSPFGSTGSGVPIATPGAAVTGTSAGFVFSPFADTTFEQAFSERALIIEFVRASLVNFILGDLASVRGSTQEVRDLGLELRDLGAQGIVALQPFMASLGVGLTLTNFDIAGISGFAGQSGTTFDNNFSTFAGFQQQRVNTFGTFVG